MPSATQSIKFDVNRLINSFHCATAMVHRDSPGLQTAAEG